MPRIQYEEHRFKPSTLVTITQAQAIVERYQAQGYDLTLRQLYYQMVSRDLIKNNVKEYNRLGDVLSKARRAGMIDWNAIVDRTRNLRSLPTWDSPSSIVEAVAQQFRYDRWQKQPSYVEVWFEKEALMGVFERPANALRLPFFACKGYPSDSEVWSAAQRMRGMRTKSKIILHFGDHDPSGIDMTRDIRDRLRLFGSGTVDVRRLALNMDQIEQYDPPPNPAKESDSRFADYLLNYGDESWELDALEPTVLARIVTDELNTIIERRTWDASIAEEQKARRELQGISDNYDDVALHVEETFGLPPLADDDENDDEEDADAE